LQPLTDKPTISLHREPVDFRKAVNGLMIIVEQEMELSPFDDVVFVFCNKSHDKVKVLYWEQTGFCLWYKRLEKHKFNKRATIFAKACFGHPSPSKRQKSRGN
jgi:transposase